MPEAALKVESPFDSLLQLFQGAKNYFDIVAACYYTILRFQRNREIAFVSEIDEFANNGNKDSNNEECFDILEKFRAAISKSLANAFKESEPLLFLNELCKLLPDLVCPSQIERNLFVSFCAFYIIYAIDDLYRRLSDSEFQTDIEQLSFFDHGPLNENVCVGKCCVYFHECESFLSGFYHGSSGFRRPLRSFRLGFIFRRLLILEPTMFSSSAPRIVPVFMEESVKQQVMSNHKLRIASIPFIGNKTFDFCEVNNNESCSGVPNGAFYIKYNEHQESKHIRAVIRLLDEAIKKEAHIIVFPEYIMSLGMLDAIRKHLRKRSIDVNHLSLVFAGTNYAYDSNGKGNNILHIFNGNGREIGKYYKHSPFLTRCGEYVHGVRYDSVDVSGIDRYFRNNEVISNPGKECTIIDLSGVGRILPSICRDAIDGDYTDELAKLFMPSLLLIPAWSASVTSFNSRLSVLAETIHTSSLLCNCCNAVDEEKDIIGKFVYPRKQKSEMIAEAISLNRECGLKKDCIDEGGCMHIIDLDFGGSELNVSQKNIFCRC